MENSTIVNNLKKSEDFFDFQILRSSTPFKKNFYYDAFDLFKLYYPNLLEKGEDGFIVIYKDKEKTQVSLFNKLHNNYKAYTVLINLSLKEMLDRGIINDVSKANPLFYWGYKKIMNFLEKNKDFFVKILPDLAREIEKTTRYGELAEIGADKVITKIFGDDIEIRKTSGLGEREDALYGKDRIVSKQGKLHVIQVKSVSRVEKENNSYYIYYLGAKLYPNVDMMIFKSGIFYYAFRAKDFRNLSTLKIFGDREGYIIDEKHKILITKL
jgi:hypothetical protein